MERPSRLSPPIAIGIIILFHVVGLCGFFLPTFRPWFIRVVPFHILLMFVVVLLSQPRLSPQLIRFLLLVYFLGYTAEWIGVHKSWIFGNYGYGETLGLKLSGIPLTIGVNWFLLVFGAAVSTQYAGIKSTWIRVPLGALLLVLLDLLIEPVAIRFDYWHWADNIIPFKNYVGWFFFGAAMLALFEAFGLKKQSVVPVILLLVQYLFFGALHWG
jgi:putative membrane protein